MDVMFILECEKNKLCGIKISMIADHCGIVDKISDVRFIHASLTENVGHNENGFNFGKVFRLRKGILKFGATLAPRVISYGMA